MPLAYYSVAAAQEFWSEHWGGHSVDEMLDVAQRSPLTDMIVDALALAPGRRVLEAGCGLGQYVILLRERRWQATGVDWSAEALQACRTAREVPLARMDLRALAVRDGAFDACLSLGVVEHDVEGPDTLLAEAARVLGPRGVLVISVPYLNGVRAATAPWLVLHNRSVARRGGAFYQYAFTRREFVRALDRAGFDVLSTRPYDPARVLRRFLPRAMRRVASRATAPAATHESSRAAVAGARKLKKLLYSRIGLALLGHMVLAVARKR